MLSMQNLQNATTKNYDIAKNYYEAKRSAFTKFVSGENDKLLKLLENYIESIIDEFDENITKAVYAGVTAANRKNNEFGPVKSVVDTNAVETNKYYEIWQRLKDQLANNKIGNYQSLAAALGNEFETFLANSLMPKEYTKAIEETVEQSINSLLSGLNISQTGQIRSKGATVKGKQEIRPDLGINITGGIESNQVAYLPNSDLGVELQALIDLENLSSENVLKSSDILQEYLKMDSYGFSAKIWKDSNRKTFTNSSILQEQFQNTFDATGEKTWSSNYAGAYVVYQLSRYLINIINPLNVAMITGSKLIWMDDFIARHLFYMDVQVKKKLADSLPERGGGWEGHPEILSNAIKLRQMTGRNLSHEFNARTNKTGTISIINRKIKMK